MRGKRIVKGKFEMNTLVYLEINLKMSQLGVTHCIVFLYKCKKKKIDDDKPSINIIFQLKCDDLSIVPHYCNKIGKSFLLF